MRAFIMAAMLLVLGYVFLAIVAVVLFLSISAFAAVPEPVAPPIPEDEDYIRVWNPKKIAALDELIHADAVAGKHWKLPKGHFVRDGWIYRDVEKMPKTWAARSLAGCLEVEADPRQFNRKSYMVPLDVYERYEALLD